ncbi:MAG: chorismate synthase [Bacteroidales bacterium]|nr:chorismate synthase [Bacteroidales bacterium]
MAGNTFGKIYKLTSFGESHGKAIGGIIDGCPSRLKIDFDFIQNELNRRKPGLSDISSKRQEDDKIEFLSGIFEGKTLGTPIAFLVQNIDFKSADYDDLKEIYRPSHADYTYEQKYGIRDYRGGGRASARETIARVVAGAIAKLYLKTIGIEINAYVSQVGDIKLNKNYYELDLSQTEKNIIRCPDHDISKSMIKRIEQAKKEGDTIGGIISCIAKNVPAGLGEPVFDKLNADLGKAILSINAVKGFEIGSGFDCVNMKGSEHNDIFIKKDGKITTATNYSGGIQGGISNGQDIYFNAAFKPVPTISKEQQSIDTSGKNIKYTIKGRHDTCVLPRAVPVVEAMTAMVIIDYYLLNKMTML